MYRTNIIDSSLVGIHTYPSYLGTTFLVLAIGGTIYAILEKQRLAGLAVALLVLAWFSMGASLNPLFRAYPFSGLDAARFHLYMAPLMAIVGAALVERALLYMRDIWPTLTRRIRPPNSHRLRYFFVIAVVAAILVFPAIEARRAREFMAPYRVNSSVNEAISWLGVQPSIVDESGVDESGVDQSRDRIYAVGLWTWHSFLIPYLANKPLIDGWHDESASNVREIRELRLMGWTGQVDIQRAHQILLNQQAGYVLVKRVSEYPVENSNLFWNGFETYPEWFKKREQWGDVAVFQVLR